MIVWLGWENIQEWQILQVINGCLRSAKCVITRLTEEFF